MNTALTKTLAVLEVGKQHIVDLKGYGILSDRADVVVQRRDAYHWTVLGGGISRVSRTVETAPQASREVELLIEKIKKEELLHLAIEIEERTGQPNLVHNGKIELGLEAARIIVALLRAEAKS